MIGEWAEDMELIDELVQTFDEEAVRNGNKISVHEHPKYYLPITETLEEIETRTKELPGEAAPETDPGAGIGIKPDTDLLGSKIK